MQGSRRERRRCDGVGDGGDKVLCGASGGGDVSGGDNGHSKVEAAVAEAALADACAVRSQGTHGSLLSNRRGCLAPIRRVRLTDLPGCITTSI
eukprot:1145947-Pleurochrysis_carterae.AAC.1